jgi:hypothetical protein
LFLAYETNLTQAAMIHGYIDGRSRRSTVRLMTDLRSWLMTDVEDALARLDHQVLDLVPANRRHEQPGGGNSINWVTYHLSRHAALALCVLDHIPLSASPLVGAGVSADGGAGLDEAEQSWGANLDAGDVADYAHEVLVLVRERVARLDPDELDTVPDVDSILEASAVGRDGYGWLYAMWSGKPASFLVRWPIVGHVTNHVGEMIATRNRMGLSPF